MGIKTTTIVTSWLAASAVGCVDTGKDTGNDSGGFVDGTTAGDDLTGPGNASTPPPTGETGDTGLQATTTGTTTTGT